MTTSIVSRSSTESALQVNNVDALVFNSSGGLSSVSSINGGQLAGMRNRIINGACDVAQRGSLVASAGLSGYGGPDRFSTENNIAGGQFTQSASTLTFGGVSKNAIRQTVNTGTTAFTTTNYWYGIQQRIEGFNSYDLVGKPVTISFIFNTNLTGTYSVALRDGTTSQSYVTSFSATANTPVKVVVAVPPIPLAAAVPKSNGNGLNVVVGFQNQATYQTATLNTWQASNLVTVTGATIWAATAGNFIELTELQLEEGATATAFERRSYGQELVLCQRYYQNIRVGWAGVAPTTGISFGSVYSLLTAMRAIPALSQLVAVSVSNFPTTAPSLGEITTTNFRAFKNAVTGSTGQSNWTSDIEASAEL
jgi:hypothetical protein